MAVNIGNNGIGGAYVGNTSVSAIYQGDVKVWPSDIDFSKCMLINANSAGTLSTSYKYVFVNLTEMVALGTEVTTKTDSYATDFPSYSSPVSVIDNGDGTYGFSGTPLVVSFSGTSIATNIYTDTGKFPFKYYHSLYIEKGAKGDNPQGYYLDWNCDNMVSIETASSGSGGALLSYVDGIVRFYIWMKDASDNHPIMGIYRII